MLLRTRKEHIVPILPEIARGGDAHFSDGVLHVTWEAGVKRLQLLANISDGEQPRPAGLDRWDGSIWGGSPKANLHPYSVFVAVGAR